MNNATLKILGMRSPLFEFFAFQSVKYPNLLVTMDSGRSGCSSGCGWCMGLGFVRCLAQKLLICQGNGVA
jgi:hypothetical protein